MQYEVVVLGVLPGFQEPEVKIALAKLFSLTQEKAGAILNAGRTVVKSGVDEVLGQKYITKLSQIGVYAELSPVQVEIEPQETLTEALKQGSHAHSNSDNQSNSGAQSSNETREVPFVFKGEGFEYFKIWIVNILLTIVTFGIYSAWAKVRNKQYFYGNTYIDDSSFSYTANPVKILIGRIVAVVFFAIYSASGQFSIALTLLMGLLMLVFLPWVICRSLHFNARYSNYRNVIFTFNGQIKDAFMAFIVWPFVAMITLGIMMPYAFYKQRNFVLGNHSYGTSSFEFLAEARDYYRVFLIFLGAMFLVAFGVAALSFIGLSVLMPIIIPVLYFIAFAYFTVTVSNIQYNNLALVEHKFSANWEVKSYAILLLTNTLGVVFTLGLFIPWAKVRSARYAAEHTSCTLVGNIDNFVAEEAENVDALGESVGDIFDIDVGF